MVDTALTSDSWDSAAGKARAHQDEHHALAAALRHSDDNSHHEPADDHGHSHGPKPGAADGKAYVKALRAPLQELAGA